MLLFLHNALDTVSYWRNKIQNILAELGLCSKFECQGEIEDGSCLVGRRNHANFVLHILGPWKRSMCLIVWFVQISAWDLWACPSIQFVLPFFQSFVKLNTPVLQSKSQYFNTKVCRVRSLKPFTHSFIVGWGWSRRHSIVLLSAIIMHDTDTPPHGYTADVWNVPPACYSIARTRA